MIRVPKSYFCVPLFLLSFVFLAVSPAAFAQGAEIEIGSGTVDHDRIQATRWTRINFTTSISGAHTIRVSWNNDADIRFTLFQVVDAPAPNNRVEIASSSGAANLQEVTEILSDSEQYYLGVWAASGSASFSANIEEETVVADPLEIVSQPADQTVADGEDAIFTVAANGSGTLSYQWFESTTAITGAISDTLTISPASLVDSGNTYSVVISDDTGSITSTSAILTVDEDIQSPVTLITFGSGILDSEKVAGPSWVQVDLESLGTATHTITVLWDSDADVRFNVFESNGTRISGSAVKGLNPGVWVGELNGTEQYYIGLWSSEGIANYTATVSADTDTPSPLEIVTQPADIALTEGENAIFTVAATGSGALSYQWFANNIAISGATDDTLTISPTSLADSSTSYSVVVNDDNGSVTSDTVTLTVNEVLVPLVVTEQPVDLTVIEGEDAVFSIAATGSGALSYQWFANTVAINGATEDTLTLSSTTLADTGTGYSVVVTDDNGSFDSEIAILVVVEGVVLPVSVVEIGQGTVDAEKNFGPRWIRIDFNSLATAMHTITVSWDSDADVRFNVFAANDDLISNQTVQGANPGIWAGELNANEQYYIALWSTNGISNYTATIEANVPVSIDSQPPDLIVTEGEHATFTVVASGSGTLSYQWFANGVALPGETGDSLTVFTTFLADDGTEYTVDVSNSIEAVTSDIATLTVNEPVILGLFSQEADTSTWVLDGPAPTLDFQAGENTLAWGRVLLRVGDVLLVGGDFEGIKPTHTGPLTERPWLAALNAVTGQPVSTFQVPFQVDSVVRALVISPSGEQVYVGGDFGLLVLNATTGELDIDVNVTNGDELGRVFDIAVTQSQVYIGGDFSHIDNTFRANIARLSLNGELDLSWSPNVTNGFSNGRSAPVQALAVSTSGDTVYVGGNFSFIDGVAVDTTPQNGNISLLAVSAIDETVKAERFSADVNNNTKALQVHDIEVTDSYVIVAWGGPNFLTFHSLSGDRLVQYRAKGDVQALQIVGNHVFVGHHGEFFGTFNNPVPQEAVISIDPEIVEPYKMHSFRIDDPSFPVEQTWQISGAFGIWGIAAAEDSIWLAGQVFRAGSNEHLVDGLVRFPAVD